MFNYTRAAGQGNGDRCALMNCYEKLTGMDDILK
jgi:hypothetical protein